MDDKDKEFNLFIKSIKDFFLPVLPFIIIKKLLPLTLYSSIALSAFLENWAIFQRAGALIVSITIIGASSIFIKRFKKANISTFIEFVTHNLSQSKIEEMKFATQYLENRFSSGDIQQEVIQNILKSLTLWAISGTLINGFGDLIQYPWDYLLSVLPVFELSTTKNDLCIKQIGNLHSWICDAFKQL